MSKESREKPHIVTWLLFAVILTLLISSTTLSRYLTTVSGAGTATVAAVAMEKGEVSFDTANLKPGGTAAYTFAVTNRREGRVSDVAQSYSVTVTATGNLPLAYSLEPLDSTPALSKIAGELVWTGGSLPHTKATTHTYSLTVSWPADRKSAALADEIDLITVTVDAQQADGSIS